MPSAIAWETAAATATCVNTVSQLPPILQLPPPILQLPSAILQLPSARLPDLGIQSSFFPAVSHDPAVVEASTSESADAQRRTRLLQLLSRRPARPGTGVSGTLPARPGTDESGTLHASRVAV
jgi:hypothetical protein